MHRTRSWVGLSLALSVLLPLPALASLSVHPGALEVVVTAGASATVALHVTNEGPASPLGYTIDDDQAWLGASPSAGEIVAGTEVEIAIAVDAAGLAPGTYAGTVNVGDPHHGGIPVAVTLRVTATTPVREGTWGAVKAIYR